MPLPNTCAHWRLTNTRAVSGLSGDVSQLATAVRRPEDVAVGTICGPGAGQQRREAGLHFVELAVVDALEQHVGRRRVGVAQLAHRRDVARILRLDRVEGLELLVERLVLRVAVLVLLLQVADRVARAARQRPQVAVVDPAVVGVALGLGLGDGRARVGHEAGQAVGLQLLDHGLEQGVLLVADALRRLPPTSPASPGIRPWPALRAALTSSFQLVFTKNAWNW